MGLLPSKPDLSAEAESGPRVVGVDSEDADDLMSALTSRTARRLLSLLHEEPAPPSGLADQVDTSLQNVQYHLERLEDAGAVEVVGTAYSEKGREMDVYAPADAPLVIYAGREEEASGLRAALSRLVGGVAALAVGAVAVQETFGGGVPFPVARTGSGGDDAGGAGGDGGDGGDGGGAGSADAPEPTPTPGDEAVSLTEAPTGTPTPAAEPSKGTTTPVPTGAAETATGTPAPAATGTAAPTPEPTPVATGTPAPEATGTPSPVATEAATPVPTEAATATPSPEPTPAATAAEVAGVATDTARTVTEAAGGGAFEPAALPPGLLFFLGGAVVLVAAVALTYGR